MTPDDWPPVAVVVPDDIRELEADLIAYRRELRQRVRRERVHRLLLTRHWTKYGFTAPVVVFALVAASLSGGVMSLFAARIADSVAAAPLATTTAAVGQIGGLVPAVTVTVDAVGLSVRELRPALIAVIPAGCACAALIRSLVRQSAEYSVRLVLVSHGLSSADQSALRPAALGRATWAVDSSTAFSTSYGARSLVFVRADGVVTDVVTAPSSGARYEAQLARLGDVPAATG